MLSVVMATEGKSPMKEERVERVGGQIKNGFRRKTRGKEFVNGKRTKLSVKVRQK